MFLLATESTSNTTTTTTVSSVSSVASVVSKLYVLGVTILYDFHWNHNPQHKQGQRQQGQQHLGTGHRAGSSGGIKMNNVNEVNNDDHHERVPLTTSQISRRRNDKNSKTSTTDQRDYYNDDDNHEDYDGSTPSSNRRRNRRSSTMTNFEIAASSSPQSSSQSSTTAGGILSGSILCCMPCFDGWLSDNTTFDFDIFNNGTSSWNNNNNKDKNDNQILEGHAFDIIIVQNSDTGRLFQNSDFTVVFPGVSMSSSSTKRTKSGRSKSTSDEDDDESTTFRTDQQQKDYKVVLEIQGREDRNDGRPVWFPILPKNQSTRNKRRRRRKSNGGKIGQQDGYIDNDNESQNQADDNDNSDSSESTTFDDQRFWGCCHPDAGYVPPKTISTIHTLNSTATSTPTTTTENDDGDPDQNAYVDDPTMALEPFLQLGKNTVRYLLLDDTTIVGIADASIFLWQHTDQLVICDIDGTITKSNARGVIDTLVTRQYRHCHDGVCKMLSRLLGHISTENEEEHRTETKDEEDKVPSPTRRILYVTSRPLILVNPTKSFLTSLSQDNWSLPNGPVLGFNGSLLKVGLMEAFSKTTHHFKAETILRNVVEPFERATKVGTKPHGEDVKKGPSLLSSVPLFLAGFGNTLMDIRAYHAVGVEIDRLFLINKQSKIATFDKEHALLKRRRDVQNSNNCITGTFSEERVHMDGLSYSVTFRHQDWYKQRIGRSFNGCDDGTLISRFHALGDKIDDALSSTNDFQDEVLLVV